MTIYDSGLLFGATLYTIFIIIVIIIINRLFQM